MAIQNKKERWYSPGKSLNWHKTDSQSKRRKAALASRKNNPLTTAKALNALANVQSGQHGDVETHRKALADAKYFFRLYAKEKNKKEKSHAKN